VPRLLRFLSWQASAISVPNGLPGPAGRPDCDAAWQGRIEKKVCNSAHRSAGAGGGFSDRSFAKQPLQSVGSERRAPRSGSEGRGDVYRGRSPSTETRTEHFKNQLPPNQILLTMSLLSRNTYIALSQPTYIITRPCVFLGGVPYPSIKQASLSG
jgi:hypothetical protein